MEKDKKISQTLLRILEINRFAQSSAHGGNRLKKEFVSKVDPEHAGNQPSDLKMRKGVKKRFIDMGFE